MAKYYKTTEQRSGSLLGIEVNDYVLTAKNEAEVQIIENSELYKSNRIVPYVTGKQVESAKKTYLNEVFTADEQEQLKELLTPAEIKDAIALLMRGKKEKSPEVPEQQAVTIDTFTLAELKAMLSEMKVEYKNNASKQTLFALYQDASSKE